MLRGLSIGYSVKRARQDPGTGVRQLMEVDLWEVSLVTFPANEAATVTVVKGHVPPETRLLAAIDRAARALRGHRPR